VSEKCQIYDLQECLRKLDKLGVDGQEKHYLQIAEAIVELARNAANLRKQIIS
jgi:hypothetical protein